jgi:Chaperone of endosialidase
MWMSLSDRIAKLENAPDGAQDSADTAQATASVAYAQSIQAAQAANQAALQAGVALQSANGKNQVHYSTSGPSGSGQNGDIWFQTDSSFNVLYQYVYNSGSWQNSPITSTVIASLDAGKITTGTLSSIAIYAGSSGQFQVSAAGVVSAISGTVGGWTLTSSGFTSGSGSYIYTSGQTGLNGVLTVTHSSSYYSYISSLQIAVYMYLTGGYGVTTDWSPQNDNSVNLGISGSRRWSHIYANNTTVTTSDERLKTEVKTSELGLDFIKLLRPVSYKWITGGNQVVLDENGKPITEGEDELGKPIMKTIAIPGKRTHYGFIAQEVKTILNNLNVGDFAGWVQDDLSDPNSYQSLSYEQFISPIVKAIQELDQRIGALETK